MLTLPSGISLHTHNIPGSGPLIIFLHEALGSVEQWKDFPHQLCAATGWPGLVYSRAGYGKSEGSVLPRPDDFLHNAAVQELHHVIQQVSPQQPAVLYGHSDGGSIALAYATRYPENVLAIVSEAAHVMVEPETVAGVIPVKELYANGMREKLMKYHGQRVDDVFMAWWETWQRPTFQHWDIRPLLKYIPCPVLAIQGENDQYGTPAQVEAIGSHVSGPATTQILPAVNHHPHREATAQVIAQVSAFLHALPLDDLYHFRRLERVYHHAPVNQKFVPRLIVHHASARSYMPADPEYFHAGGGMHGAMYFKVLDDTAYFACQSVEKEFFLLTGEFNIRFLKPVTGGEVYAEGRLLENHGKKMIASATLYWNGEPAAEGQGVFLRSRLPLNDLASYGGTRKL